MITTLSSPSTGLQLGYTMPSSEQVDMLPLPNPFYEHSSPSIFVSNGTYTNPARNLRMLIGGHSFKLFTTLQARHSVRKAFSAIKKGDNMAIFDYKPEEFMEYIVYAQKNPNFKRTLESRFGSETVKKAMSQFVIASFAKRPFKRTSPTKSSIF